MYVHKECLFFQFTADARNLQRSVLHYWLINCRIYLCSVFGKLQSRSPLLESSALLNFCVNKHSSLKNCCKIK
jgi:hypothetical protein